MKWKELIKIAINKGYRFYAHGKNMTSTSTTTASV